MFTGAYTSTSMSVRVVGTYYYRVKASNAFGESDWSNVQSVAVTVPPPPCPQAGSWSGATDKGYRITFAVADTPECEIFDITIYHSGCPFGVRLEFIGRYPIDNYHFNTGHPSTYVRGDFTSPTEADGTFRVEETCPGVPPYTRVWSGTWTASYTPE